MSDKEKYIIQILQEVEHATSQDIFEHFQKNGKDIKLPTIRWHLHQLAEKNKIGRKARGVYYIPKNNQSKTQLIYESSNKELYNLAWYIKGFLPEIPLCIWDTDVYNRFSLHQKVKSTAIIEVPYYSFESVMEHIGRSKFVFILENYFRDTQSTSAEFNKQRILLKKLPLESPTYKTNGDFQIPTIEKLLVDLIADSDVFHFGYSDIQTIASNYIERYFINLSTLHNYALYRNKVNEVFSILNPIFAKYDSPHFFSEKSF